MIPGRKVADDAATEQEVSIEAGRVTLQGTLGLPKDAGAVVLFAHGSGSSRHSPRNRHVAQVLRAAGIGTLLFDLLTAEEESLDEPTGEMRFNILFLARRLADATRWLAQQPDMARMRLGYFGASTGAAAALMAAAKLHGRIDAVVSRGGRPDLAGEMLTFVKVPVLLIVGEKDEAVIEMNRAALTQLGSKVKTIHVVPRARHLFEEPGALEEVARLASDWFRMYLGASASKATAQK